MKKLSHSACAKYMSCPASYDFYYNQRIRPAKVGSALMFGSAMDAALNDVLLANGNDPLESYRKAIREFEVGTVVPNKYDYDHELMSESDVTALLSRLNKAGYKGDDPAGLFSALVDRPADTLSDNQSKAIDLVARAGLEVKARLILDAYKRIVLPNITTVHNVQKRSGPGFLDATVDWKGRGKIILDNKTSSRPYADDAIQYSAQLAMYAAEENISQVAFIVMVKNIKKNRVKTCGTCGHVGKGSHKTCDNMIEAADKNGDYFDGVTVRCGGEWTITVQPEAEIQVLHGDITTQALEVARELQREVARAVEASIYPCNIGSCNSMYGRKCDYRDLKWKGSMVGMEYYGDKGKKK